MPEIRLWCVNVHVHVSTTQAEYSNMNKKHQKTGLGCGVHIAYWWISWCVRRERKCVLWRRGKWCSYGSVIPSAAILIGPVACWYIQCYVAPVLPEWPTAIRKHEWEVLLKDVPHSFIKHIFKKNTWSQLRQIFT